MPDGSPIASLDGFRMVAVLLVITAHSRFGYLVPGGFGVTIFFVRSGHLITILMHRERSRAGSNAVPAFFIRRAFRLMPVLLAVLIGAYGLAALWVLDVLWSLTVQEHFYLIYPFAFIGLMRLRDLRSRLALIVLVQAGILAWRIAGSATTSVSTPMVCARRP